MKKLRFRLLVPFALATGLMGSTFLAIATPGGSATGTTGLVTSGSTAGEDGEDFPDPVANHFPLGIYPQYVTEYKSQGTYRLNGGSVEHPNRHVLRIDCQVGGGFEVKNPSAPDEDYPGTDPSKTVSRWEDFPDIIIPRNSSIWLMGVGSPESGYEIGPVASVPTSATTTAAGVGFGKPGTEPLEAGDVIPVQISSTGALSSTSMTLVIGERLEWHSKRIFYYTDSTQDTQWIYHKQTNYYRLDLDIAKLMCGDASVDTRRMFGQANRDRVVVPDANEPLRNVKFGSWQYNGGLFVGNMPYSSDQSGTARAQFYRPSGGTGDLLAGALVLVDGGTPSWLGSAISDIGLYVPASSDPNLSVTEADTSWATRWDVQPYNSSLEGYRYRPVWHNNMYGTASGDYVQWQFKSKYTYGDYPDVFQKVVLALKNENTLPTSGPLAWRYFVGREYSNMPALGFPGNDCAPRIWRIGRTSESRWTVTP